ncbi:MAG: M28 family peptidase [Treponema sp.]|nr:M28 family peptidase [Treponema sp.]
MYQIPSAFNDFISPNCDRAAFIQNYLKQGGIESSVLQLEGKNHIYVKFPKTQYNPMFRIKTVIAHYDRIGIGANDNSAAVFCLMEWARNFGPHMVAQHNIRLIFTDGEELGEQGGVEEQGAFPLAQTFRKLGITNDDIYVFDCMGRGDVPILAQAKIPPNVPTKFLTAYSELEARTKQLLKSASNGKWFTLPVNYSDNASFIANGIPAVAITMLPSEEVQLVLKGEPPKTWTNLHTPYDNLDSLNPAAFEIFYKILNELAAQKTVL